MNSIDFAENIQYKEKYFELKEKLGTLNEQIKSQKVILYFLSKINIF